MIDAVLTKEDVERFVQNDAVLLKAASSRELADEYGEVLWTATGCDDHDPSTWTRPVVPTEGRGDAPFVAAANTERLRAAFDQLAGTGRWVPRDGLETLPIRFPVDDAPDDGGWHGANANSDAIVAPGVARAGAAIAVPVQRRRAERSADPATSR